MPASIKTQCTLLEFGQIVRTDRRAADPRILHLPLARIPAKWNHFAEKDSRQINILEQILIAKVFNFGGICSKRRPLWRGTSQPPDRPRHRTRPRSDSTR